MNAVCTEIISLLSQSYDLREICAMEHIPDYNTVSMWLSNSMYNDKFAEFRTHYAETKKNLLMLMADDVYHSAKQLPKHTFLNAKTGEEKIQTSVLQAHKELQSAYKVQLSTFKDYGKSTGTAKSKEAPRGQLYKDMISLGHFSKFPIEEEHYRYVSGKLELAVPVSMEQATIFSGIPEEDLLKLMRQEITSYQGEEILDKEHLNCIILPNFKQTEILHLNAFYHTTDQLNRAPLASCTELESGRPINKIIGDHIHPKLVPYIRIDDLGYYNYLGISKRDQHLYIMSRWPKTDCWIHKTNGSVIYEPLE